jgi:hypothetical protein
LHRLMSEPGRLFWRYASTNLHATYLLLVGTHGLERIGQEAVPANTRR